MLERVLKQFKLSIAAMHEVEDSFSSTVYKCSLLNGENVYLKIPYTKVKYQRELETYQILAGAVSIPDMLDCWSGDEECPGAFILSELKGKPLTSTASPAIAFQVGELQAAMHKIQPSEGNKLTGIQNEFPDWADFIERQFYSFAEDVKDVLDEELYEKSIAKFEEMKRRLPNPDGPSFIHMDFRPANIIVDDNQVLGMIDFESVRFGSTEVDFTKLYRDFLSWDPELYKSYREGYTSIRPLIDLEAVLPFYRFIDAFNSIGWTQRRGMEKNLTFYEENLVRLKEMMLEKGRIGQ